MDLANLIEGWFFILYEQAISWTMYSLAFYRQKPIN